jgi:Kef-type K+ transport system membrane component KefB
MSLSDDQVVQALLALTLLLTAAHATGRLFERLHQPAVIGEILGGLLLGRPCSARSRPGCRPPCSRAPGRPRLR